MTWLPLIPQVSAQILAMLQKGELDQATALKLLGQNAPDTQNDQNPEKNPGYDDTDAGDDEGDHAMEDVDILLNQAKRLRNATLLNKLDPNSFNIYSSTFQIWFLLDMFIPGIGSMIHVKMSNFPISDVSIAS